MTTASESNIDINKVFNSSFKWSNIDWTDVEFNDLETNEINYDNYIINTNENIKNIRQLEDVGFESYYEPEYLYETSEPATSDNHENLQNFEADHINMQEKYEQYVDNDDYEIDKHKNPYIAYRRFRDALTQAYFSNLSEAIDEPLSMELLNHDQHVKKLLRRRISIKMQVEAEMIELRDSLSRAQLKEQFEFEKERLKNEHEKAIKKLAEKMLKENEEERKQLEAEMSAIGANGEAPHNFQYLPSRKLLRRRAGNYIETLIAQVERVDNFPIHQVHWIDCRDIVDDLEFFDNILKQKEKPYADRHQSIIVHENRITVDGKTYSRGHQIVYVKSRSFGTFPAIILSLSDTSNCMTLRSNIKGDPRHITVTFHDLETGKVKLSKKPW